MTEPCSENAEQQPGKSGTKVVSTGEAYEGQAQNTMAEICGGRTERCEIDIETTRKQAKDQRKWRSLVGTPHAT